MEPSFWEFSLETYKKPDAEAACLRLQNEHDADVNLLLLCCYSGRHGVRLTDETLAVLANQAAAWQTEVVGPLRALRRRLKQPVGAVGVEQAAALREGIKRLELDAEQLEQEMLQTALVALPGQDGRAAERHGLARANLIMYLRRLGVAARDRVRDDLETLISASFPDERG